MGMKNSSRTGSTEIMPLVLYTGSVSLPVMWRRRQRGGGRGGLARVKAPAGGVQCQRRRQKVINPSRGAPLGVSCLTRHPIKLRNAVAHTNKRAPAAAVVVGAPASARTLQTISAANRAHMATSLKCALRAMAD